MKNKNKVNFVSCTQDEYDSLVIKDVYALYYTSDTHRMYKGYNLYTKESEYNIKDENLIITMLT